jgi:hypothetical protein
MRPASAGSVYLFDDNVLLVNRRHVTAPTRPLYHSVPCGYEDTREHIETEEGIKATAERQLANEHLLVTRDGSLLAPLGQVTNVLGSAANLGIDLNRMGFHTFETKHGEGPDVLEAYRISGHETDPPEELLFRARGFVGATWEDEVKLGFLRITRVCGYNSTDVLPVNAKGNIITKGPRKGFQHFDKESCFVPLEGFNLKFGDRFEGEVYRTQWEETANGRIPRPVLDRTGYPARRKFYGPDKTTVEHPHIFAPDFLLGSVLDGLNIAGYNWIDNELEREERKLAEEKIK